MTGTSANTSQRDIFRPLLTDFIDPNQELAILADRIDWDYFEEAFAGHYSHTAQPAIPIRIMVGCLLLKRIYNYGDETLTKAWVMNLYIQYFCGEAYFQHTFPCDPSGFVHFRKRIGEQGVAKIFSYSVAIHELDGRVNQVLSDTTVQENDVIFPTDAKLAKKVFDYCNCIALAENVDQRQSYEKVSKQLLCDSYFGHNPRRVILAIKTFEGNPHDSKTIAPLLEQIQSDQRPLPREVIYDRGGRGIKEVLDVKITTPDKAKASDSAAKKRRMRRRFRRRAGIEPIIGHLKTDHRLGQNYLHGEESPQINAWLAVAGWNLKKWMKQWVRDGKNGYILHGCTLPENTFTNPF